MTQNVGAVPFAMDGQFAVQHQAVADDAEGTEDDGGRGGVTAQDARHDRVNLSRAVEGEQAVAVQGEEAGGLRLQQTRAVTRRDTRRRDTHDAAP